MKITSTAFADGGEIPLKYTCEGKDISPPLSWEDVPEGTQSLVLIGKRWGMADPLHRSGGIAIITSCMLWISRLMV